MQGILEFAFDPTGDPRPGPGKDLRHGRGPGPVEPAEETIIVVQEIDFCFRGLMRCPPNGLKMKTIHPDIDERFEIIGSPPKKLKN